VGRPVIVNSGGSVAPGSPTQNGTLQAASLTWNGGGAVALDLGPASDALVLTGALSKGVAGTYALALTASEPLPVGATYTLITFASTDFTAADISVSPPADHEGVLTVDGGSVQFRITKHDQAPPVLALPESRTVEATGPLGAVATFTATASDAVDGDVAVSYSHSPGGVFPLGVTSVTVTATDLSGNTAAGSFTVTVEDTTAPALSAPADLTLEATGPAGAVATFAAAATDLVDGDVPVVFSRASGSVFPLGITTVTLTATDAASNASAGSFTVTVRDATAPAFLKLKARPDTLWPPDGRMKRVRIEARVTDAVDRRPRTRIVSVSSNERTPGEAPGCNVPPRHRPRGCSEVDWSITGDLTLKLRAERDRHGEGRIYTITVESRDHAGNVATRTTTVEVPKHRPRHR
jgi:HYR domain